MELPQQLARDLDGAFAELVIRHQDLVFGVALRVVGRRADAEDVAQEAFVRAYRALKGYSADRVLSLLIRPWLARITLNAARNQLRSHRPADALDAAREQAEREPVAPRWTEPVSLAERREEKLLWSRLLAGMPERYRLAVALRHVEGLSYSELAATLDRPLGSVKSDVHRGVQLLRAAYEAEQRRVETREAV